MKRILSPKRDRLLAKVCVFLVMAALISGMVGCTGDGYTPSKNLEIRTWYDLDDVRDNLAGHHILMNNLDSTSPGYIELAGQTANEGKGWQPIANDPGANFTGTFDGQGYEIRDLFINRPDEYRVGLFSFVYEGAVIKNLGVTNITAICGGYSGGLAGTINDCTVSNSHSSGNVTGSGFVGGLVGINSGNVNNCYATCNVTGSGLAGGLVGTNSGNVNNCYATGNVTGGGPYVGGLIGANMGTVSKCYSTGSVTGTRCTGGLAGANGFYDPGTVSDSYSTGSVTGVDYVGGLVGVNYDSVVSNSYSTGSVTGSNFTGGLVGGNYTGAVSNSFWDTETSGQTTSAGGTGKNTTEMKDINTLSDVGWNIVAVALNETNLAYAWNIVNNVTYPFLSWQAI